MIFIRNICLAATAAASAAACVKAATTNTGVAAGAASVVADDGGFDEKSDRRHDDAPQPFDETRNAMLDVDAALASARVNGKRVLLALGGNWCHDSRGLAAKFERPALASVIENGYELVWVDVGRRDRNLDVAARFGVFELFGTPTVLILSPDGELVNADTVHDWRDADAKSYEDTFAYFERFAGPVQE